MGKISILRRCLASVAALSLCAGAVSGSYPDFIADSPIVASAATEDPRLTVDLNANDGRKASYSKNAENWNVPGETTASTTINGITFKLSNGGTAGGDLRSVNYKVLQQMSGIYPRKTMDGVTINDTTSGGVIKLEISGLSAGTHSLKTWHSCVDNATVGTLSVSINGTKTATGVSCPTRVTDEDDAGISYSTFNVSSGQTVTVLISPEGSGNAWLNAFEIDGADPIKGISRITPEHQDAHHDVEEGLSWTAGSGAKSHDVYIGTDFSSVYNATTSSAEFKGNQTGTTYALDDTYSSIPTYYWRVDTIDSSGNVIKGAVNSFQVNRLAFPTAEGYGRYARGGRGGRIVEVTNLNDSGEGSLRWALEEEKGPRIVVFKVGGVIPLESVLCIPEDGGDVYVAGQTAPGDGITLINYTFGALGSSDVVIRDIRTRVGDVSQKSMGGMGLGSCDQSIIDHCSISWATDEGFSSRSAQNITFQWNIIGETLNESVHYGVDENGNHTGTEPHSFAASISGYTGSFHHNLLIDNTGRNWSLAGALEQDGKTYGGQVDIRNNVVYNWRDRTTDGGVRRLNFVNNYYKAGAVSDTSLHVVQIDGDELGFGDMQKMYVSGNIMTATNGSYVLNASDDAWAKGKAKANPNIGCSESDVRSNSPFFESYVNTETAEAAYKSVIAAAGAGGTSATGWDYIDSRYIKEVTNGTYTYSGSSAGLNGIIDSQNDAGGYPNTSNFEHSTAAPTDSDHDGMPDAWETEHGLNPNNASDGPIVSLSADDYTNVEMYLNELCGDPVDFNGSTLKQGAVMDTTVKYMFKNANSGLYLEVADGTAASGTNVQQGTTGAVGWTLTDAGDGYYYLYSEVGDGQTYCLDLPYGSTANGESLGIWTNDESDARKFKFVENGDGTYAIVTKSTADTSGVGVVSASTEEGADVVQWACNDSDDQKWIAEIKIDPIDGNLIKNLLVTQDALYKVWSIDESLAVGDLVFGDREGVTYRSLPDELIGAEAILTACDAKYVDADLATFQAGADIIVYVGLDSRVTPAPSWLDEYTLTDMTAENVKDVVFNLYAKEVKAGETVTLGMNGYDGSCVSYVVFAVEDAAEVVTTTTTTTTEEPVTTTTTTTASEDEDVVLGDSDLSGDVELNDAVLIMCHIADEESFPMDEQQKNNADVYQRGDGVNNMDALSIQKKIAQLIPSLPESVL